MVVDGARAVIDRAIRDRIFPAAVAEVGNRRDVLWRHAFGRLTFDAAEPATAEHTVFDLASLTKPMATTSVVLRLVAGGRLDVREPVAAFFAEWRGEDRERATVRDLLEHASGLAARLVDPPPHVRREFEHDICTMPLEYAPRSRSIYSDLGFILLGFIVEDRGRSTLDRQFDDVMRAAAPGVSDPQGLSFDVRHLRPDSIAPTSPEQNDPRRGRILRGAVHDDYAAALGGIAGHAGLFGSAEGVGRFARAMLGGALRDETMAAPFSPALVSEATTTSDVAGSSRALGWDTMLPTSSCGSRMSPAAFGHVGFTGTSLWIDPGADRYFVLLTNRVSGGGTIEQMREVRRAFHDALAENPG
jgi:CubicO group peptidase (beta-lactamase class C family)